MGVSYLMAIITGMSPFNQPIRWPHMHAISIMSNLAWIFAEAAAAFRHRCCVMIIRDDAKAMFVRHRLVSTCSDHSGYGHSQWQKALHSNTSSHWLSSYPELSLTMSLNKHDKRGRHGSIIAKTFVNTSLKWRLFPLQCGFVANVLMSNRK